MGTGFLASSRILITAAHCLYTKEGWIEGVRIKLNGGEEIRSTSFIVPAGWAAEQNLDYDFGAIILNDALAKLGHFGLCTVETSIIDSVILHCAGFPAPDANKIEEQERTLMHAANKAKVIDLEIKYNFFGGIGSSGSPLWVRTASGHRLVVAIHHRNAGQSKSHERYGLLLRGEVLEIIDSWIKEVDNPRALSEN